MKDLPFSAWIKRASLRVITLCACFSVLALGGVASAERYDVLIRDGSVIDGTGVPRFHADIAIKGERIAAIGKIDDGVKAKRVINANGLFVAPGFIDPHAHAAPGIEKASLAPAAQLLFEGITTVFLNPDGGGPPTLDNQIANLKKHKPGVNTAPAIGHNAVRRAIMGEDDRTPTPEEQARMEALVRDAMDAGAFGLSSGPFYTPGKYSKTEEIIGLARVAAEYPGAFHTSHIRDESNYNIGVLGAIDEVIEVSRKTGIVGVITHLKMLGPAVWGRSGDAIKMINDARDEGLSVWADQYPYAASGTSLKAALVPGWARDGGDQKMISRLRDMELRPKIRQEMEKNLERRAGAHAIMIRNYAPNPDYVGRRLDEVAQDMGVHPLDAAIELLINDAPSIISFNMNEYDLEAIMRQPWTMTSSDGTLSEPGVRLEHPRSFGAFPRKIRRYVLERGVITLEHAIHAATGLTAKVHNVKERGELRVGHYADIIVFDLETIDDTATYEVPEAMAHGMKYVLVNGKLALIDGQVADDQYGRVLLRDKQ
ncbi:N-acyl-D-amino-acid deacylase family protein [Hyphococcus lacteus]|uniref:Amidohydrolase family protein n=1 Tax=Hyphococcus lacteus TaxID=3143536 RepID=A0ABV3Z433_9PROT